MDLGEKNNLVRETIAFPVKYDKNQQTIRDSKGMMVCDIRGWEKIQYMDRCEERQDAIGEKIARLLNECKGESNEFPGMPEKTNPFASKEKVVFEWD